MPDIQPFRGAFRDKRVLLTGHTGFKGSWMAIWLHALGARVSGLALPPPTTPSNFVASDVRSLLQHHFESDVRDARKVEDAIREVEPHVVVHLAAQPLVRTGYENPRETFEINVMGTVNLLDALRAIGRPCVCLVVSSDKCYENREHVWGYREIDAMGGRDPYSASKGCVELVVSAMRRSYFPVDEVSRHGVKVASVRAGNVIGGGDWARDRILADVFRALQQGQPIEVRNPNAVRPWQHVLEPLHGYLTLAAAMLTSDEPRWLDGWNFGPLTGGDLPVRELVALAIEAYGCGTWRDVSDETRPHEARLLRLSVDKAVAELGWRPRWGPREAVTRAALWYRRFHDRGEGRMHEQCLADLEAFRHTRPP